MDTLRSCARSRSVTRGFSLDIFEQRLNSPTNLYRRDLALTITTSGQFKPIMHLRPSLDTNEAWAISFSVNVSRERSQSKGRRCTSFRETARLNVRRLDVYGRR